jgi:hypothetical protein
MHIINLTIKCKNATGDSTKIVCMNSDYVVRLTTEDCGTFTNATVKKLVVRYGREYREVDIKNVTIEDETFLQATLPPIERADYVDLGVCGKETDDENAVPVYSSTSARFHCDKSILSGAVIKFSDPTLTSLKVIENGTYKAGDHASDGFHTVEVSVAGGNTEMRQVDLAMSEGDQEIYPTKTGYAMSKVRVRKPDTLTPENIVKDVDIGGVVGTFEKKFTEQNIFLDGEYTPPEGYDGFSKVTVSVGKSSREKVMRVGQTFSYQYNTSATVEMSQSGIVQYADSGAMITFTALALGTCMVTITDYNASRDIVNVVYYEVDVTATGDVTLPIEVSSPSEMNEYLERGATGGILKYVGDTTDTFKKNSYYLIEEV